MRVALLGAGWIGRLRGVQVLRVAVATTTSMSEKRLVRVAEIQP